jgi:ABC-type branched-subunit amino acid transport system ATPase component
MARPCSSGLTKMSSVATLGILHSWRKLINGAKQTTEVNKRNKLAYQMTPYSKPQTNCKAGRLAGGEKEFNAALANQW